MGDKAGSQYGQAGFELWKWQHCRTFWAVAQDISRAGLVDNEWKNGWNPKGKQRNKKGCYGVNM